jgi:hypothetical protein
MTAERTSIGRSAAVVEARPRLEESTTARRGRLIVGGFFLCTGGVHLGIVAADTSFYTHFADQALLTFVRDGWSEIFMSTPVFWGLCLFLGETALGVLLMIGGPGARVGWVGVIAFHLLLMLFGIGFWLWSLPALVVLVPLARLDWPYCSPRQS